MIILEEDLASGTTDSLKVYELTQPFNTSQENNLQIDSFVRIPKPNSLYLDRTKIEAGSSPEVELIFTENSSEAMVYGKLEIFGSTNIPFPGMNREPLAELNLNGTSRAYLTSELLQKIPYVAWPWGSVRGENDYRFSVTVTDSNRTGIEYEFAFIRNLKRFVVYDTSIGPATTHARLNIELQPKIDLILNAKIIEPLSAGHKLFVFMLGTNHLAETESLNGAWRFHFKGIPKGRHTGHLAIYKESISVDSSATSDSIRVYTFGEFSPDFSHFSIPSSSTPKLFPRPGEFQ